MIVICAFKLSLHETRVTFNRAFNSLYSKCYKSSEDVLLQLVSTHCKLFLVYGMEAVSPTKSELNSLGLGYTYIAAICTISKLSYSSGAW